MFLNKITVQNFRLLKDFSVDLEQELSLIIGKNNSGKTSLLYLLDKIFHWRDKGSCIHIDDFNLDYKKSLVDMLTKDEDINEDDYQEDGVRLRLYIKYHDEDDLSNVGLIMMDLDENNYIDGYSLDVEQLVYNELLVGWPTKILCSEDCKGICSVCGQNLNQGSCDCEDTSLDPRMSVIRDVFKNFKEV